MPEGFAAAMDALGPFEPSPKLAVAVSGGADSTALAILACEWAHARGGSIQALVVDHGLRPASANEARVTIERLSALDIPARLLPLTNLPHGPALAQRARTERYAALAHACLHENILHLLLGHHAADQVETLMMRVLQGSQTHGLAAMPTLRETPGVRLLRPLLGTDPATLRSFLSAAGVAWVEDPSNQSMTALRSRLRHRLPNQGQAELAKAIRAAGQMRAAEETATAAELAARVTIRPEGFALLSPGRIGPAALSRLIRTVGGLSYPPSPDQIAGLAAQPRPATVAGVRITPAGQLGAGWLIVREEAAVMEPIPAAPNAKWDNRFRIAGQTGTPATIGKLGVDAARFRRTSDLPSLVLRTLPAIRHGNCLASVPHLGYATLGHDKPIRVMFSPPEPIAGACFSPGNQGSGRLP